MIKEPGKYKVVKAFTCRGTVSVSTIPSGAVITVTQVDGDKIIGPDMEDWTDGAQIEAVKMEEV